ncbi:uncharacterized protein [Musca autumnalis]|uniref:uncharacterized protein n=1 Tax=Musca autumnalis TaxID=221902 RepID=UPI003CEB120E
MVSHKVIGTLLVASCLLVLVQSASTNKPMNKKRLTGLYVKDNKNGELRFLVSNAQINQAINQKQNFLEQLRPTTTGTGTGTGTGITPIIINTATAGATATGTATGTATAPVTATGTATGTGTIATTGPSPIGDLLPQIVAQAALQRKRPGNKRRRVVNNRRRVNRRRPNKGNNKKKPQVFVVRPGN